MKHSAYIWLSDWGRSASVCCPLKVRFMAVRVQPLRLSPARIVSTPRLTSHQVLENFHLVFPGRGGGFLFGIFELLFQALLAIRCCWRILTTTILGRCPVRSQVDILCTCHRLQEYQCWEPFSTKIVFWMPHTKFKLSYINSSHVICWQAKLLTSYNMRQLEGWKNNKWIKSFNSS